MILSSTVSTSLKNKEKVIVAYDQNKNECKTFEEVC